jgi:hypothetical protein
MTAARAERAVGENGFELLRSLGKLAGGVQSEVGGKRHFYF